MVTVADSRKCDMKWDGEFKRNHRICWVDIARNQGVAVGFKAGSSNFSRQGASLRLNSVQKVPYDVALCDGKQQHKKPLAAEGWT